MAELDADQDTNPNHTQPDILKSIQENRNSYPDLPLADQETDFRILELLPGQHGDPLRCVLSRVSLRDYAPPQSRSSGATNTDKAGALPINEVLNCKDMAADSISRPYEALSYVWGIFSNKTMQVNGEDGYLITDNLASALRHLRKPDISRTLWTDSICINQTDLYERGAQVRSMRSIYERASRVLVWLGEPPAGTAPVLAYSKWAIAFHLAMHGDLAWWRRMWTVQEVAVAKEIIVHYGTMELSWEALVSMYKEVRSLLESRSTAASVIAEPAPNITLDGNTAAMEDAIEGATSALSTIDHYRAGRLADLSWRSSQSDHMDLRDWLLTTDKRSSTEPRDKVFGIIGLTTVPLMLDGTLIVPNYFKSLGTVCYKRSCWNAKVLTS